MRGNKGFTIITNLISLALIGVALTIIMNTEHAVKNIHEQNNINRKIIYEISVAINELGIAENWDDATLLRISKDESIKGNNLSIRCNKIGDTEYGTEKVEIVIIMEEKERKISLERRITGGK